MMNYFYPFHSYPKVGMDVTAYDRLLYDQYLLRQWQQFYEWLEKDQGDFPKDGLIQWWRYRELQERQRMFLSSLYRPVLYFPTQYQL